MKCGRSIIDREIHISCPIPPSPNTLTDLPQREIERERERKGEGGKQKHRHQDQTKLKKALDPTRLNVVPISMGPSHSLDNEIG